jgi:two-component system OmpR family sensor kinase
MFSSRHRKSLRLRLTGVLVTMLAAVCLIIGLVTEIAVKSFLHHQLDRQVTEASHRSADFAGFVTAPRPPSPEDGQRRPAPFELPGVRAVFVDGVAHNAEKTTPGSGAEETLTDEELAVLAAVPVDGRVRTRTLGGDDYRVIAETSRTGAVVVTGASLSDVNSTLVSLGWILLGVALAGLLTAGVGGAVLVRRNLRPLDRVAATASRVAELPLDRGEVALAVRVPEQDSDPDTEVGQVGLALNRMLGHIGDALAARHASETRVRQFVADASHELRTPLAAIRGYAELTRRTRHEVSPEIAHAMRRVESEADRMTALVEDLLLLARLDAGRPLEHVEVDLSRLVLDAVSDARIAGGGHDWKLELPAEPVTVRGDGARLHQVLANLLSNARTHTPPGTTVVTGIAVARDGRVELSVADDGPGIPRDLLPEVFERFARGDGSRSRAAGSTGLGLSIVAAVVAAHRGTVRADSEPGRTVFTVRLPGDVPPACSHS